MKRYRFLAACIMTFFLLGCVARVYGAEENSLSIPVTVSWGAEGLQPKKNYQLILEGTEGGEPVPDGASGKYTLELDKNSRITQLPEILYHAPGEYTYILKLIREDGSETGCYYIHVTVRYGEDNELHVTYSVHRDTVQGEKTDQILFRDKDTPAVTPDITAVPDVTEAPEVTEIPGTTEKTAVTRIPFITEIPDSSASSGSTREDAVRGKAGQVKTGDETKSLCYLLAGCAALFCILVVEKRKKKL